VEHLDNRQALCIPDHRLKCEQERHTYGSAWSSRLSRDVIEGLLNSPAPRQLVYGDGQQATELDVVSCRSFALQKAKRLPIADILDRIGAYTPALHRGNFDFVFIDAGSPDIHKPENFCSYAGPRWYSLDLAQWILEHRITNAAGEPINESHFGAVFQASRSITGRELEVVYDRMRSAIELGMLENGNQARPYAASLPKLCILSMQGLWNAKIAQAWEWCESSTRDDAPWSYTRNGNYQTRASPST